MEGIYSSIGGKIHFSLRTRGPQRLSELAKWLRADIKTVHHAIGRDDRIGWRGCPVSNAANLIVRLVTKEGVVEWPA